MTTLSFFSSRDKDIAVGICIGRGYRVTKMRTQSMPMKIRIDAKLTPRQVEYLNEQVAAARDY